MKKLTLIVLALFPLLASPAPPAIPAATEDTELDALRERLVDAEGREQWEAAAVSLLAALDRRGGSQEMEVTWLISHLLESFPDDPRLLWRRAMSERTSGETDAAVADLEHLVDVAPDHPFGVRARRTLPALYLLLGQTQKSADADEALLRDRLADPIGVLSRLARTYSLLDDAQKVRRTLLRLEKLAPQRLAFDPDVLWLAAGAAQRVGSTEEGLSLMLRFTNLFPRDPRRPQALLNAGIGYRELGNLDLALQLIDEAVDSAFEPGVAVQGRLTQAMILEDLGRIDDAREQYKAVIEAALAPAPAAQALERLLAIEREARGTRGALLMLASMIHRGDPFVREMARNHFDGLMREINAELEKDPKHAAFYFELARHVSQVRALSPGAQISAARMREQIGSYQNAGQIYKSLTKSFGPPNVPAIKGLARTQPAEEPKGSKPLDPERLTALERDESWQVILSVLKGPALEGKAEAEHRRLAARARWSRGETKQAHELLEPISGARAEAALLRGDARALFGQWETACKDYRAAMPAYDHGPERAWLEVRIAACEIRSGKPQKAKKRLETLLSRKPLMPASFAAEDLLSRIAEPSS